MIEDKLNVTYTFLMKATSSVFEKKWLFYTVFRPLLITISRGNFAVKWVHI
jgi:hypothetical protein